MDEEYDDEPIIEPRHYWTVDVSLEEHPSVWGGFNEDEARWQFSFACGQYPEEDVLLWRGGDLMAERTSGKPRVEWPDGFKTNP